MKPPNFENLLIFNKKFRSFLRLIQTPNSMFELAGFPAPIIPSTPLLFWLPMALHKQHKIIAKFKWLLICFSLILLSCCLIHNSNNNVSMFLQCSNKLQFNMVITITISNNNNARLFIRFVFIFRVKGAKNYWKELGLGSRPIDFPIREWTFDHVRQILSPFMCDPLSGLLHRMGDKIYYEEKRPLILGIFAMVESLDKMICGNWLRLINTQR